MSKPHQKFKVYRLENAKGQGPFSGHPEREWGGELKTHSDPVELFHAMGYPQAMLGVLLESGFVFGWRTQARFRSFFHRGGFKVCQQLGYECRTYEPLVALTLLDGQVLFLRDAQVDLMRRCGELPTILLASVLRTLAQRGTIDANGDLSLSPLQFQRVLDNTKRKPQR